jgi:amidase
MRVARMVTDLLDLDATALAAAIARGDVTSTAAVTACLARIGAVDGVLGAFVDVRAEAALAEGPPTPAPGPCTASRSP